MSHFSDQHQLWLSKPLARAANNAGIHNAQVAPIQTALCMQRSAACRMCLTRADRSANRAVAARGPMGTSTLIGVVLGTALAVRPPKAAGGLPALRPGWRACRWGQGLAVAHRTVAGRQSGARPWPGHRPPCLLSGTGAGHRSRLCHCGTPPSSSMPILR